MDIVTKSFRKDETLTSWTLLQHICPHFWAWLLNTIAIMPKSKDKYVEKVFNWSEVHFSEMTCYKIHTLNECYLVEGKKQRSRNRNSKKYVFTDFVGKLSYSSKKLKNSILCSVPCNYFIDLSSVHIVGFF